MPLLPLALLLSAAQAHYPHDVAAWVAVSPGTEPRWVITTLVREEALYLLRSENQRDFAVRYVMDGEDGVRSCGRLLDEQLLVLGTDGRGLWVSEDAGDSFQRQGDIPHDASVLDIEVSPEVLEDGLALAAGSQLWLTEDGGLRWEPLLEEGAPDLLDVDLSPDWSQDGRAAVLDEEGWVLTSEGFGHSWQIGAQLPGSPAGVAVGPGQRIWGASFDQGLWLSEDGGDSWQASTLGVREVALVADLGGGLVLAAAKDEAVWRSEDDGASWALHSRGVEETEPDQPSDNLHYFELLEDGDGAIWMASWEGLQRSADLGRSWRALQTEGPWNIRSVDLSYAADGSLLAVLGTYGSGITVNALDLSRVETFSQSLLKLYVRRAAAPRDWDAAGSAFLTSSGGLFATTDGGLTWDDLERAGLEQAERLRLAPDFLQDPTVLVSGAQGGLASFAVSEDAGASWRLGSTDQDCEATGTALALSPTWSQDGTAWGSCYAPGVVFRSTDRGRTWSARGEVDAGVFGLAVASGGELALAAAANGLHILEGESSPRLLAFGEQAVFDVALSPGWPEDAAIYALVAGEGWQRSEDGGESWTELPAPSQDAPRAIALSPDFSDDGTLVVAGYGGAWASQDRGDSWFSVHAVEWYDQDDPAWRDDGRWERKHEGSQGWLKADGAGAELAFGFRGIGVELLAYTSRGGGQLLAQLDGGQERLVSLVGEAGDAQEVLAYRDLEDDWHELRLAVLSGEAKLDGARVWRLELQQEEEIEGCGCAQAGRRGAAGVLLLGCLLWLRGRRWGAYAWPQGMTSR